MFAYTLDCVDIARAGVNKERLGKSETDVLEQIKQIEKIFTLPLLGFDSDNGSEFLNYHSSDISHKENARPFTRSRAYHKDDNAHIDRKTGPTSVNGWATNA